MRKDVLSIVLNQMSQNELITAFMKLANLDNVSNSDHKIEWALGLYPSINTAWIAKHDEDIRKWVMENVPNVKEMRVGADPEPWCDITVKLLLSEDQYSVKNEDAEQYEKAYNEAFEGITLDNAQEKVDTFYRLLRERGISYVYYGGNGRKKVSVYAVRSIDIDRDYINSLDKITPL